VSTYSDVAKKMARLSPDISCSGKDRFPSQTLAAKVANSSNRRKDGDVSAYRCGTCGTWHVGGASIARQRMYRDFKAKRAAPLEDEA
jgi:hypothetical protein